MNSAAHKPMIPMYLLIQLLQNEAKFVKHQVQMILDNNLKRIQKKRYRFNEERTLGHGRNSMMEGRLYHSFKMSVTTSMGQLRTDMKYYRLFIPRTI